MIALATQVEEELFNFFKDTGQKYKNKYRSLVFNLKDQKNNLFRRVADKSLSPHQLVRLTPEELASTELAQWREREAKHEIDMIKKTELENLSQSKVRTFIRFTFIIVFLFLHSRLDVDTLPRILIIRFSRNLFVFLVYIFRFSCALMLDL